MRMKIISLKFFLLFRSTSRLIGEKEVISIAHILAVAESSKHGAPDIKKFEFSTKVFTFV